LWWGDAIMRSTQFETTTYDDLRWMARRIAQISREDVRWAFEQGGFPKEVVELFVIKIMNRRNEILKAFDLTNEIAEEKIPDIDSFSPNAAVKNGKVVVSGFPGHNHSEVRN